MTSHDHTDEKLREARRKIRNRLVENGIDPNEFFQSATLGVDHGGDHKDTVAQTLADSIDPIEEWKRFRAYAEPELNGYDHHYRTGWQIVEWSDTASDWVPVQFRPDDATPGIIETNPQCVNYDEFSDWLQERENPPLERLTLTDVPRKDLPSVFHTVMTKLADTTDVRIEAWPNTAGDAYDITWELIRWHGDPNDGEWVVLGD